MELILTSVVLTDPGVWLAIAHSTLCLYPVAHGKKSSWCVGCVRVIQCVKRSASVPSSSKAL